MSAASKKSSLARRITAAGAIILIGGAIILWAHESAAPRAAANIRAVDAAAADLAVKGAEHAESNLESIVDSYKGDNLGDVAVAGNKTADQVADEQAVAAAWRARARNEFVLDPSYHTNVENQWGDCWPLDTKLEIHTVSGYVTNYGRRIRDAAAPLLSGVPITSGWEEVGPQGTDYADIGIGYPLPLPDNSRYLAFIGRLADSKTLKAVSEPFLIGGGWRGEQMLGVCVQTAVNRNPNRGGAEGGFTFKKRIIR